MAQIDFDGFESGDKTGFDGTNSGGTADTDSVQGTVTYEGSYAWHFEFVTNDYNGYTNNCYFSQSEPTGGILWMRAAIRLDVLTYQYSSAGWLAIIGVDKSNGAPWDVCAGAVFGRDGSGNYRYGVWIRETDGTNNLSWSSTAIDIDDTFYEYKIKIDNSGTDPIVTLWRDGDLIHSNTFTGITLPTYNEAVFGFHTLNWGNHDIEAYFDSCGTYTSDPDTPAARITQDVVETILTPADRAARVTQAVLEVLLRSSSIAARITQSAVEVVIGVSEEPPPAVTQKRGPKIQSV